MSPVEGLREEEVRRGRRNESEEERATENPPQTPPWIAGRAGSQQEGEIGERVLPTCLLPALPA